MYHFKLKILHPGHYWEISLRVRNYFFRHNVASHPSAEEIVASRRAESTREQYISAIQRIFAVIREKFPERFETFIDREGYLTATVPFDVYCSVLDTMSRCFNPNGEVTMMSQSSFATVGTSFVYWHEISQERVTDDSLPRITLGENHKKYFNEYAKGRKRIIARYRTHGLITSKEGKTYLSFSGYRLLAKKGLLEATNPRQSLLAHAFTVIGWNLIGRSVTVGPLLWNNVGWVGDCMTMLYETSKTNQEGINVVPRHVFANPIDPLICPVLALGLKLIHESDIVEGVPSKIFYGSCGEHRFSQWLKRRMEEMTPEEISELGCPASEIGTHSLRKGAATYACGLTNGPHSDSVKLRMDHTIGGTDDKYINIQAGADKMVGRCVTGLDSNSDDFCYLPPTFVNYDGVNFAHVLPDGRLENASPSLRAAIPFLIASVIFHAEWLENNLPRTHPYFSSKLYRGGFGIAWSDKVKLYKRYCPETGLTMSGVPGYAQVARAVTELREQVVRNHEDTTARLDEMPERIGDYVLSRIGSAHGVQVSNEEMINRVLHHNFPDLRDIANNLRNLIMFNRAQDATRTPSQDNHPAEFAQFEWGRAQKYPCSCERALCIMFLKAI